VELNVSEQRDNCRRETETRRQRDGRDGPITPSRSVVATREGLSGVFRGSLRALSPEARSQVSGRFRLHLCGPGLAVVHSSVTFEWVKYSNGIYMIQWGH